MLRIMQYLGELVLAQLDNKKPSNIPEGIQVEELEYIACNNHMNYIILQALLKTDLPEEKKASMKSIIMQSTILSLTQVGCIRELEERLEQEGIYHQILKGSVIKRIYPSPEMREMSDIDVMIYDENMNRAKRVVEGMGFTLLCSIKHHDIYVKPPFLTIELHYELFSKNVNQNQYDYFHNEKHTNVKEGRKYALQFSTEDFYVYLIVHMAKHFYEAGCGIRNVVDIYYYRRLYQVAWDEVYIENKLEECGVLEFEKRVHTLARVWLGGEEIDKFSQNLFEYLVECGIYGKGENGIWGQIATLNHTPIIKNKSHARLWYYFPPISYMQRDYPWLIKQPHLLGLAWGIRAITGLFNKEGRKKREMLLDIDNDKVNKIYEIYKGMQLNFKNEKTKG
ncbi:nucleotidyltransferase domain-containing protein [Anaeromicropila herbilytica]|uniref:Nucleotidyltransferase family protein n=1 Tax=Anaeromicropila herbilytica TaxID=2785025 RepID=A0A7R7EHT3_9FIRM|nr:nucleotidyltransferase family protein [Anaeromicropila herbilytica]BCN29022.1 hypothetical protein bsdtb5_03170 [Anaeromicropila herbilytica]